MKKEAYDANEFGFAKKSLSARQREYLGDFTTGPKCNPSSRLEQINRVKIDAQVRRTVIISQFIASRSQI